MDADVAAVELKMVAGRRLGTSILGYWTVEGAVPHPGPAMLSRSGEDDVRLLLVEAGPRLFGGEPQTPGLKADGTFAFEHVGPGAYRLAMTWLRPGLYVKDVRFDDVDGLTQPFVVPGSGVHVLEVLLSPHAAVVEGVVTDVQSAPAAGGQVVLVPAMRERLNLYQSTTADGAGRFRFGTVAPGDYTVFAWQAVDDYAFFDPEVLRRAAGHGVPVSAAESVRSRVDLTVIPERAVLP